MTKRPSKNISLYINYPTPERLEQLRERVKTWNMIDKMKEQRLSKIATQKEIVSYLMGDAETIAKVDVRQKEIDRRKGKQEQITEPKPAESKEQEYRLPIFVKDVLDGEAYPEKYECDAREQKILYNQKFIELYQQYRTAKSQTTADILLSQIVSLVKGLDQ